MGALASIEHAVVPDHAHNAMARLIGAGVEDRRELLRRGPIAPRRQQRELPLVVDAGENVVIDQVCLSRSSRSQSGSAAAVTPDWCWTSVSVTNLARADLRLVQPLLDDRYAGGRCRVRHDLAHPQMVVLEHLVPAALLRVVMLRHRPPPHDRLFVAPGRVRQDPSWAARALEALIVDEPVHPLQDRLQVLRQIEIEVELFLPGMDFEDH